MKPDVAKVPRQSPPPPRFQPSGQRGSTPGITRPEASGHPAPPGAFAWELRTIAGARVEAAGRVLRGCGPTAAETAEGSTDTPGVGVGGRVV